MIAADTKNNGLSMARQAEFCGAHLMADDRYEGRCGHVCRRGHKARDCCLGLLVLLVVAVVITAMFLLIFFVLRDLTTVSDKRRADIEAQSRSESESLSLLTPPSSEPPHPQVTPSPGTERIFMDDTVINESSNNAHVDVNRGTSQPVLSVMAVLSRESSSDDNENLSGASTEKKITPTHFEPDNTLIEDEKVPIFHEEAVYSPSNQSQNNQTGETTDSPPRDHMKIDEGTPTETLAHDNEAMKDKDLPSEAKSSAETNKTLVNSFFVEINQNEVVSNSTEFGNGAVTKRPFSHLLWPDGIGSNSSNSSAEQTHKTALPIVFEPFIVVSSEPTDTYELLDDEGFIGVSQTNGESSSDGEITENHWSPDDSSDNPITEVKFSTVSTQKMEMVADDQIDDTTLAPVIIAAFSPSVSTQSPADSTTSSSKGFDVEDDNMSEPDNFETQDSTLKESLTDETIDESSEKNTEYHLDSDINRNDGNPMEKDFVSNINESSVRDIEHIKVELDTSGITDQTVILLATHYVPTEPAVSLEKSKPLMDENLPVIANHNASVQETEEMTSDTLAKSATDPQNGFGLRIVEAPTDLATGKPDGQESRQTTNDSEYTIDVVVSDTRGQAHVAPEFAADIVTASAQPDWMNPTTTSTTTQSTPHKIHLITSPPVAEEKAVKSTTGASALPVLGDGDSSESENTVAFIQDSSTVSTTLSSLLSGEALAALARDDIGRLIGAASRQKSARAIDLNSSSLNLLPSAPQKPPNNGTHDIFQHGTVPREDLSLRWVNVDENGDFSGETFLSEEQMRANEWIPEKEDTASFVGRENLWTDINEDFSGQRSQDEFIYEQTESSRSSVCDIDAARCDDGSCIAATAVCDGLAHCPDASDETDCSSGDGPSLA